MSASPAVSRREELLPVIRELREDEGLTWREIGERLGISLKTAQGYYVDPTGEKTAARRARNNGTCLDCGAETKNGGARIAPLRCRTCASEARIKWTREEIVAAIRRWAELYGKPPSANDWNIASSWHKGERVVRWRSGDWPHVTTIQARFGGWNAAIGAAGFPTQSPNGRRGLPQAEIDRTIELYRQGYSLSAIGKEMGVTSTAIRFRLERAGIPRSLKTGRNEPMAAPLRAEAVIDREIERIEARCEKLRQELAESENTVARLRLAQEALSSTIGAGAKAN